MLEKMTVNDKEFEIIKLLGKGKGGYSYLATDGEKNYVLKQIHHEPCVNFCIRQIRILTIFQRILLCRMGRCFTLILNAIIIWKNGTLKIGV